MRTEITPEQLDRLIAEGLAVPFMRGTAGRGDTVLQFITGTAGRYFYVPAIVRRAYTTSVLAEFEFTFAGGLNIDCIRAQDHRDGGDHSFILRTARTPDIGVTGWTDEKLSRLRDAARELLDTALDLDDSTIAGLRERLDVIEAERTRRNHHIDRPNAVQLGEAAAWLSLRGVPLRDRRTDEQIIAAADKLYPGGMAQLMRDCDAPPVHGERYRRADGTCGCDLCRFDARPNVAAILRYGD